MNDNMRERNERFGRIHQLLFNAARYPHDFECDIETRAAIWGEYGWEFEGSNGFVVKYKKAPLSIRSYWEVFLNSSLVFYDWSGHKQIFVDGVWVGHLVDDLVKISDKIDIANERHQRRRKAKRRLIRMKKVDQQRILTETANDEKQFTEW